MLRIISTIDLAILKVLNSPTAFFPLNLFVHHDSRAQSKATHRQARTELAEGMGLRPSENESPQDVTRDDLPVFLLVTISF